MRDTFYSQRYPVLAAMLREERDKKGVSMRELGRSLGWPHTIIAKIESGVRRVDVVELEAICQALGISPVEFMRRFSRRTSSFDGEATEARASREAKLDAQAEYFEEHFGKS